MPLAVTQSSAAPNARRAGSEPHAVSDSFTRPWQAKYEAIRRAAVQQRLETGGKGPAERVGRKVYGRVTQRGEDRVFVVLAEFGSTEHSAYCSSTEADACAFPSDGTAKRVSGPRHNRIPRPDRSVDNSTLWQSDYTREHYRNMYFDRMRRFYEQQSSGRYSIGGSVTEWVRVPFNAARYGRDFCGDIVCNNTWFLIRDSLALWTQDRIDAGWSQERIQRYLRTFDHQDRYDFDGDGDFREPDGYIDHFQIVHAGGDQASGSVTPSGAVADPQYGTDAIWSHRSYAEIHPADGTSGPEGGAPLGRSEERRVGKECRSR